MTVATVFDSDAPAQTATHGCVLGAAARPGEVWALVGDLGAGKTHFVQGIVAGVGASGPATSPTFALLHEYTGGRLSVFHFDFYRLETAGEALALGLEEYLDGDGLTVIEWADKFPALLPSGTRWFRFEILDGDRRRIAENSSL